MPGNWDGKTRPSNDRYRKNFDDIFKKEKEEDAKKEKANKEKAGQEKKT